jgi:vitamin B12/bleomycin/antimicrobial peptide transport system ATP-binding/permease protein
MVAKQTAPDLDVKFRFDGKFWGQLQRISQPFFYPLEPGGAWKFWGLIAALILLVVTFTFFVSVGLALLGNAVFPAFFATSAKGWLAESQADLRSPKLYLSIIGLLLGSSVFYAFREKLKARWPQWILLGMLLFLVYGVSRLNVILSFVFRFIDNALTENKPELFWQIMAVYGIVLVIAIPIIISYRYLRLKLGLLWRKSMTQDFMDRYLSDRAYYKLDSNNTSTRIDNPDQRMTEDIRSFTSLLAPPTTILDFLLDILDSVLNLIAFTGILYAIDQRLLYGALGYAIVGSILLFFVALNLVQLNFKQLRTEANFRYGLIHVRDNAESIAFYQGEDLERQKILQRFAFVLLNFDRLIVSSSFIAVFQRAYDYFSRLVPYAVLAPLFFAKTIDFGSIAQASTAFSIILGSLSIIPSRIQEIAIFLASVIRLADLDEVLPAEHVNNRMSSSEAGGIQMHLAPQFTLSQLSLNTPNAEQHLIENLSLELRAQESLLVVGPSGCGKSSLLRAIAGLWTNGSGTIERPDISETLFLPQKPYMLLGSLREQLLYPSLREGVSEAEIQEALKLVNLEELPDRVGGFDAEKDWSTILSMGEQQRLAFARIFLSQPRHVILDEATSALDVANERRLYDLLANLKLTYISVGHRPTLIDYHQSVLALRGGGDWQLMPAQDYRFDLV